MLHGSTGTWEWAVAHAARNEMNQMTLSLRLSIIVFVLTIGTFAQTSETFDILTFTPPAGWKKEKKDGGVVLFVTMDKVRFRDEQIVIK